ncbi:glycosyltransferase [Luteibaculum oceani]|uniref:Glycosyltransferase n=1 Tax=Luteibaculum oceani TaxID=1294296 RepID=A0A5C6VD56_9FLAO|nr:glycosyltransferase [Luteibaculum oceani]TXC81545.1 glycosyltransferase [Luteibaculum oceani]
MPSFFSFEILLVSIAAVVVLCYKVFLLLGLKGRKLLMDETTQVSVSVVIAAKNELKNLSKHIPLWMRQKNVEFEVIVVNDRSWDQSEKILKRFSDQYPNFSFSTVTENMQVWEGKKFALTLGIKKAKYNYILVTDADCYPNREDLVAEVAKHLANRGNLVLGYAPFSRSKGILGWIQQFENLRTAISYYATAMRFKPYMGVGRFMAYSKELYQSVGGFKSHYQIPFGDDDLFVQSVKKVAKVSCVHPSFQVISEPKITFISWWKQRTRHLKSGAFYGWDTKIFLSIPFLFLILFYSGIGYLLLTGVNLIGVAMVLGGYYIASMAFGFIAGKFFSRASLGIFAPFMELIILISHPLIYLSGKRKTKANW